VPIIGLPSPVLRSAKREKELERERECDAHGWNMRER
jgi:hypothetical protein